MSKTTEYNCDVLIIGAGVTGSMLARQLHFELPELDILQVESKTAFDHGLGESSVEGLDIYADWACKLGPYLEKWYINKHGLRFFFDNEERNLEVPRMAEYGRAVPHRFRASQLDRSKIDQDLVDMNRELGIRVKLGVRVLGGRSSDNLSKHISINGKSGHVVETSEGAIRCKWLIDSAGLAAPVGRMLGGFRPDTRLPVSAYWARFEDCNVIDELGDDEWRAKMENIQRFNSTNHFMYDGHWWWLIPLTDNRWSIGVCWHQEHAPNKLKIKNGEQLEALLRTYGWGRQILGNKAKLLDFKGLSQLAHYSTKRFSEDRWYLTGMSSLVIDPINSNTCRIFPENNTYIVELIKSDLAGNMDLHRRQLALFELRMQQIYDGTYEAYRHYDYYSSYDVTAPFMMGNIATYWNLIVPDFVTRFEKIKALAQVYEPNSSNVSGIATFSSKLLGSFSRHSAEMKSYLEKNNKLYANNSDKSIKQPGAEDRDAINNKFMRRDEEAENHENLVSYELVVKMHVERMAELENRSFSERAFKNAFQQDLDSAQTLADLTASSSTPRPRT